jgi:hypothetical protein
MQAFDDPSLDMANRASNGLRLPAIVRAGYNFEWSRKFDDGY